ncbi:MAG: serine/threonine-protein kinase [Desulfobacteraceae bacterium]|jgi:serine/threonine protein kinase
MSKAYSQYTLPVGTMVQEYKIIEILGIGNFGIVYSAENKYFSEIVALKEFLPSDLAYRSEDESRVHPLSSETEKAFSYARHKFLQEAKTLRELGHPEPHPNIVRVRQFIEANDTAYMVMDFEKGQPLINILEERGTLPEEELGSILHALLDGLDRVHGASVWHRDIKPSNILIRPDGSPVLIDFGAARKDVSGTDRSTMAVFSPAYAAPEQIYPVGDQGPWTDIYSLGATLYRAVTGSLPTNAAKRMQEEIYVPAVEAAQGSYSPSFLAAIDAALQLYPKERPQSIGAWKALFTQMVLDEDDRTVLRPFSDVVPKPEPQKKKLEIKPPVVMFATAAVVAVALLIFLLILPPSDTEQTPPVTIDQSDLADTTATADFQTDSDKEPVVVSDAPHAGAQLKITSIPTAAQVFLDGASKGVTPLEATVGEGTHLLRLSLDDHYEWESSLVVGTEGEIPIRIPLLAK